MKRNVAILVFDEVEVLDFTGPFEVFGVARDPENDRVPVFNVYTVAETDAAITARNGLSVNPNHTIENCPKPDILLVPGGHGTDQVIQKTHIIDWIRQQAVDAELVLSVCTGALLLAKAGLLQGLRATTYHTAIDELQQLDPTLTTCLGERWVDNGKVVTSAGVSAGIDMSLYIVGRLFGVEHSIRTAQHMEYEHWKPETTA